MSTAGLFVPVDPSRGLDTRLPAPRPRLANGTTTAIDVADITTSAVADITTSAVAVSGTLTVTGAQAGWAQLGPAPVEVGAYSSVNTSYSSQTIANAVVSPVTGGSRLEVYNDGRMHLLFDMTGWFTGG